MEIEGERENGITPIAERRGEGKRERGERD